MSKILIPFGLAAGIGAGWWIYAGMYSKAYASGNIQLAPIVHPKYDPSRIEREIAFHEGRVKRDPQGAIGLSMLSGAYLAKSREQDDDASAWRAEAAARQSLALRRRGNIQGALKLVQALLEQHRFQDALKSVNDALRISPGDDQAKLLRADVLIEVGDYEAARKQLGKVELYDPTTMAVEARWQSATGRRQEALRIWQKAIGELEKMSHIGEELIAWYQIKAGTEFLALGQSKEAYAQFSSALTKAPKSYKAAIGLAEASLAGKDYKSAVKWCDTTLGMVNSFKAMALRGEALAAMGDAAKAQAQYERLHAAFLAEDTRYAKEGLGGPLGVRHPDREFATFCATQGMFVKDGLRAAKRDIQNRPDALAKANLKKLQELVPPSSPQKFSREKEKLVIN